MLFLLDIQFVKKANEKREGKHINQKEKKHIFEICKKKMLYLQDEEILAEEVHNYPCL